MIRRAFLNMKGTNWNYMNHTPLEGSVNKYFQSWVESRDLLQVILREWGFVLTPVELRAVLFVYDRTILWGKEWERIKLSQCREGVWHYQTGKPLAAPWASTDSTVIATLQKLVNRGVLLKKEEAPKKMLYSINRNFNPELPMKLPKNPPVARVKQAEKSSSGWSVKYNDKIREKEDKDLTVRHLETQVKEGFEKRSKERTAGKAVPAQTKIKTLWLSLSQKHSGGSSGSLNAVEAKIIQEFWKLFVRLFPAHSFVDFLTWLFECWPAIRAAQFAWMDDCPEHLPIRFVTSKKLQAILLEAWRHRAKVERRANMTVKERQEEVLREQGMTPEAVKRDRQEKDEEWIAIEEEKKRLARQQAEEKAMREKQLRQQQVIRQQQIEVEKRQRRRPVVEEAVETEEEEEGFGPWKTIN